MRTARSIVAGVGLAAVLVVGVACNSDGRTLRPASPDQTASVYTTTTSSTIAAAAGNVPTVGIAGDDPVLGAPATAFVLNLPWEDGGVIDARYTCAGADIQPGFSWSGAPAEAVEMALVVVDLDAADFVHWVIAGLDPTNPFVGENDVPVSAIEGANDFATRAPATTVPPTTGAAGGGAAAGEDPGIGWRGPCPPAGATHHYRFTLYALDRHIDLPTGAAASDLQAAIDSASVSVAQRTGVYA